MALAYGIPDAVHKQISAGRSMRDSHSDMLTDGSRGASARQAMIAGRALEKIRAWRLGSAVGFARTAAARTGITRPDDRIAPLNCRAWKESAPARRDAACFGHEHMRGVHDHAAHLADLD